MTSPLHRGNDRSTLPNVPAEIRAPAGTLPGVYDEVLLPEINLGQLALLLRARFLVDVISYNQVRGLPFKAEELAGVIQEVIEK